MKRGSIFLLVIWLILLALTIFELVIGADTGSLVGDFVALASPFIVYLTSR